MAERLAHQAPERLEIEDRSEAAGPVEWLM
jgi:hypothetical protein